MRRQTWNLRRDKSEGPIVDALRAAGAQVWRVSGTGLPDLLVRYRGVLYAGEVKTKTGKLRASQGEFPVWRTVEEAYTSVGIQLRDLR